MASAAEILDMKEFRTLLSTDLPRDLDTDFNVSRWVVGASVRGAVRRFRSYIEKRRLVGLDDPNLQQAFSAHPIIRKYAQYFAFNIEPLGTNPNDNTIVFLYRCEGLDFNAITAMMSCGQLLTFHFAIWEWNLRQILQCESDSGRKSGLTVIVDLSKFSVLPYINPLSATNKVLGISFGLLEDYYWGMINRVVILQPPLGWSIIEKLLRPDARKLFVTATEKDLHKFVHGSILPVRYGGRRRLASDTVVLFDTPWKMDPESLTLSPREITPFVPKRFSSKPTIMILKSRKEHTFLRHVQTAGSKLIWQFKANIQVRYSVSYDSMNGRKFRLAPEWTVVTPKVPEHGELICLERGFYCFLFCNVTDKEHGKIECSIDVEAPSVANQVSTDTNDRATP